MHKPKIDGITKIAFSFNQEMTNLNPAAKNTVTVTPTTKHSFFKDHNGLN